MVSKLPFTENGTYEQVNIHHINEVEDISVVVKKILLTLEEKNIYAEKVIFTYEKEKGLYELWLSSNDYILTEKEIEFKIKKIK
ncbi:MAG: hypothetical protein ACI8WT_004294 [Clostridium sp.]